MVGVIAPATTDIGSPFAYYSFQGLTAGAALTNGQSIPDSAPAGNNNHLTAVIGTAGSLVPTTGSGNHQDGNNPETRTAVQTPGYAQFTISNAPVGSNANLTLLAGGPSSGDSFSNLDNATGGANIGALGGAQDDDRILFASGKAFHLDDDGTSDTSSNFYIQITGSSVEIWNALKSSIAANTSNNVTYSIIPGGFARFHLTASSTGPAGNDNLLEVGTSFKNLVNLAGGVTGVPGVFALPDNTIASPRTDLTGSKEILIQDFPHLVDLRFKQLDILMHIVQHILFIMQCHSEISPYWGLEAAKLIPLG